MCLVYGDWCFVCGVVEADLSPNQLVLCYLDYCRRFSQHLLYRGPDLAYVFGPCNAFCDIEWCGLEVDDKYVCADCYYFIKLSREFYAVRRRVISPWITMECE